MKLERTMMNTAKRQHPFAAGRIGWSARRAFTLVEILIVVIILGILASIVIPQFANASQDAKRNSLSSTLQTVRAQLELARLQHRDKDSTIFATGGAVDPVSDPIGPWAELIVRTNVDYSTTPQAPATVCPFGPYLQAPPVNPLNTYCGVAIVSSDPTPGQAFSGGGAGIGWIYNPTNNKAWAVSAKGGHVYDEGNPANPNNDL